MTVELGLFDIALYALLLCVGTILCYMLPNSVSFRRKSYEAMALDLGSRESSKMQHISWIAYTDGISRKKHTLWRP